MLRRMRRRPLLPRRPRDQDSAAVLPRGGCIAVCRPAALRSLAGREEGQRRSSVHSDSAHFRLRPVHGVAGGRRKAQLEGQGLHSPRADSFEERQGGTCHGRRPWGRRAERDHQAHGFCKGREGRGRRHRARDHRETAQHARYPGPAHHGCALGGDRTSPDRGIGSAQALCGNRYPSRCRPRPEGTNRRKWKASTSRFRATIGASFAMSSSRRPGRMCGIVWPAICAMASRWKEQI